MTRKKSEDRVTIPYGELPDNLLEDLKKIGFKVKRKRPRKGKRG